MVDGGTITSKWELDSSGFDNGVKKVQGGIGGFLPVIGNLGMAITGINQLFELGGKALSTLSGAIGSTIGPAIQWESAFAGVVKTVDPLTTNLPKVSEGLRDMALAIPESATNLAKIAESAGQLGVKGTENILKFTETIAKIGTATNLTTDQAATEFARLANITGMPLENVDKLGSTIVALGNNFATTESEISALAMRMAAAGTQVGISEPQILGFAAALSSVGIEAEAGGSAISKVFAELANATAGGSAGFDAFTNTVGMTSTQFTELVRQGDLVKDRLSQIAQHSGQSVSSLTELATSVVNGKGSFTEFAQAAGLPANEFLKLIESGKNVSDQISTLATSTGMTRKELLELAKDAGSGGSKLEEFARVAGMSASQFSEAFKKDAAGATASFIEGLKRLSDSGENVYGVLDGLEIQEVRMRNALLSTANAGDLLRNAVDMGSKSWTENSALTEEAQKRYQTTESRITLLKNTFTELRTSIGEIFLSVLARASDALSPIIKRIDTWVDSNKELISTEIGEWFDSAISMIHTAWKDYLVPAWNWISNFITENLPTWRAITTQVGESMSETWGMISKGIDSAWSVISAIWNSIDEFVTKNFGSWGGYFTQNLENQTAYYQGIYNAISTLFVTAWEIVEQIWNDFISPFFSWLDEQVQKIGGWDTVLASFKVSIQNNFAVIQQVIQTAGDIIKTALDLLKTTFDIVFTGISAAIDLFRGDTDSALEKLSGLWTRFKETIFGIWDRIKERFTGWVDTIKGTFERLKEFTDKYVGHSEIPDAWMRGSNELEQVWQKIIGNMGDFSGQYEYILQQVAEETAQKQLQNIMQWFNSLAKLNNVAEEGLGKLEASMKQFSRGYSYTLDQIVDVNGPFLEKIRMYYQAWTDIQKGGTGRNSQLWDLLLEESGRKIGLMDNQFEYLTGKAKQLWGVDLPEIMGGSASAFTGYMDQFINQSARGEGMFQPVIDAIRDLIAELKKLMKELDDAVGHSWYTDAMEKIHKVTRVNFVGAMQEIEQYSRIGVSGIRNLQPVLSNTLPETSAITNMDRSITVKLEGTNLNLNTPALPTNAVFQQAIDTLGKSLARELVSKRGI